MQFDKQTTFSSSVAIDGARTGQPITATAISTNVIDLRPIPGSPSILDEGVEGTDMYLYVRTIQGFNNLTTLTITLESSAVPGMTSPTVHLTRTVPLAGLTANKDVARLLLPSDDYQRYLGVRYTVNGTAPTTGTLLAALALGIQQNVIYPGNFIVG